MEHHWGLVPLDKLSHLYQINTLASFFYGFSLELDR